MPERLPEIIPGGRFTMPTFIPRPQLPRTDIPENSGPAYVVYFGQDSTSGFFRHYSNSDHELGAESIVPASFRARLIKSFPTVQVAQSTYQECVHTGVLALFRVQESQNTVYVVTKGFQPGVYTSRCACQPPIFTSKLIQYVV